MSSPLPSPVWPSPPSLSRSSPPSSRSSPSVSTSPPPVIPCLQTRCTFHYCTVVPRRPAESGISSWTYAFSVTSCYLVVLTDEAQYIAMHALLCWSLLQYLPSTLLKLCAVCVPPNCRHPGHPQAHQRGPPGVHLLSGHPCSQGPRHRPPLSLFLDCGSPMPRWPRRPPLHGLWPCAAAKSKAVWRLQTATPGPPPRWEGTANRAVLLESDGLTYFWGRCAVSDGSSPSRQRVQT